jgi:hypothetical protein
VYRNLLNKNDNRKHGSAPDRPARGGSLVPLQSRPSNTRNRITHGNQKQIRPGNHHPKCSNNKSGRQETGRPTQGPVAPPNSRPKRTGQQKPKISEDTVQPLRDLSMRPRRQSNRAGTAARDLNRKYNQVNKKNDLSIKDSNKNTTELWRSLSYLPHLTGN